MKARSRATEKSISKVPTLLQSWYGSIPLSEPAEKPSLLTARYDNVEDSDNRFGRGPVKTNAIHHSVTQHFTAGVIYATNVLHSISTS